MKLQLRKKDRSCSYIESSSGRNEVFSQIILTKSLKNTSRVRGNRSQMFIKTDALKFFNIYRKTPSLESLFIKVAGLKGSSTQVYFRKHREMFRKSFFHGISLVAASEEKLLRSSTTILYFNECLKMIKIFYSGKYIPVW